MTPLSRTSPQLVARAVIAVLLCAAVVPFALVSGIEPAAAAVGPPVGTVSSFGLNVKQVGGIVSGPDGNLWFTNNNSGFPNDGLDSIGRITPAGAITIFGGPLSRPSGITAGPDGALWFANSGNNSIGRITTTGAMSFFTHASIREPIGIATGPDGALWFTNSANNSIGRIATSGAVSSYVGPGIDVPRGITAGPDGALWFTNYGARPRASRSVGRITTAGVVSSFSDPTIVNPNSIVTGPDGNLWFTNSVNYVPGPYGSQESGSIGRITPAGVVTTFYDPKLKRELNGAWQITAGPDGALWFTVGRPVYFGPGPNLPAVGRITTTGTFTFFPEPVGGGEEPITTGPDGNLWTGPGNQFADDPAGPGGSIDRITTNGTVTNFADKLSTPKEIAAGPDGNLWYTAQNAIGRITPTGQSVTFRGPGINDPVGIVAGPDGNLWFINGRVTTGPPGPIRPPSPASIARMTPAGVVTTFSDPGLIQPSRIVAGPDGNLWFGGLSDYAAQLPGKIYRVTPFGAISIFTDPAIRYRPAMVAGSDGNLWFPSANNSIGRITPAGAVSFFTDPTISGPGLIIAATDGNLWFTNYYSNSIGRITPSGIVSNFTDPTISGPDSLTAGADGNLWFRNNSSNSIGRVTLAGVVSNFTGPSIQRPYWMTAGPDGALWFINYSPDPASPGSIGRITTGGVSSLFTDPAIKGLAGIAAGPDGNMWFTNQLNVSIGQITTGAPSPPLDVIAVAGDTAASVRWAPPAINGGSPIGSYSVTAMPGGQSCGWVSGPLTCTVAGLTNGVAYRFKVTASNATTTSVSSTPSNTVVPTGPSPFFHPVPPTRILDSRTPLGGWNGVLLAGPSNTRTLPVAPMAPPSAVAVVMNVTVTNPSEGSFLTVYPAGSSAPTASNLNFGPGQTTANQVTVLSGVGGEVAFTNAAGAVDVIADVVGYYDNRPGDLFTAINPTRILDSRQPAPGWGQSPLGPGESRTLTVAGATPIPAAATAVVMNVTVTGPSEGSFLTVYPTGPSIPTASNLNFGPGQTVANQVTVTTDPWGRVSFYNALGTVEVIADVVGYYQPGTGDRFHPLAPTRALDSRGPLGNWNGPLGPGAANTRNLTLAGPNLILPANATATVTNITVTNPDAGSFLTVYPAGQPTPNTSTINFAPGQTIPNAATIRIGAAGQIAFTNQTGTTNVITDIAGYFSPT